MIYFTLCLLGLGDKLICKSLLILVSQKVFKTKLKNTVFKTYMYLVPFLKVNVKWLIFLLIIVIKTAVTYLFKADLNYLLIV